MRHSRSGPTWANRPFSTCLCQTFKAQSVNFPFCTIEPKCGRNHRARRPPDQNPVEMCQPKSVVPATVEIVDIAGLVKGASKGEGLGNKFWPTSARPMPSYMCSAVRRRQYHPCRRLGWIPCAHKEIIDYELQLNDLETVESRIAKTQNRRRPEATKLAKMQLDVLLRYKGRALDQGLPARSVSFDGQDEQKFARELFLLTNKPRCSMYVMSTTALQPPATPCVEAVREAVKGRTPRY